MGLPAWFAHLVSDEVPVHCEGRTDIDTSASGSTELDSKFIVELAQAAERGVEGLQQIPETSKRLVP